MPSFATRVDLLDTSGNVLVSVPVTNGTATADVGRYHFPLSSTIKVYESNGTVVASTPSTINVYGGDIYSAN